MNITEKITHTASLALTAVETELNAMLDAQAAGGRVELRQLKETAALLKELLGLCRDLGASDEPDRLTVRFEGEVSGAAE